MCKDRATETEGVTKSEKDKLVKRKRKERLEVNERRKLWICGNLKVSVFKIYVIP